jgi:prepilin-type N-terminal cleavage/methylation domain-containing protein
MCAAHQPPVRARERALTLVEVTIVLVIVAILLAALLWATRSTRSASGRASVVAAARTYGDAIDDFRKDHGGRPPALGNARDWPDSAAGPRSAYTGDGYLGGAVPEAVAGRIATVAAAAPTATRWTIRYATSARGWRITVEDSQRSTPTCTIAGGTPPAAPAGVGPC